MKKMILLSLAALFLTPGITKPMNASDACEITWYLSQIAAGSTATMAVYAILKGCYDKCTAGPQAPLKPQPMAPAPAPVKPQQRPAQNQKKKNQKWSTSSASSASASESTANTNRFPKLLDTLKKPQEGYYERLKNLPSRCAQTITRDNILKSWITLAVAIAAYTTTRAGIEGIGEYFV